MSDITFGVLASGHGLLAGGLRAELGNWKQGGEWFAQKGWKVPHLHWGKGPGLQNHHLPWQFGDWLRNLHGLTRRGKGGNDLRNLGEIGVGLLALLRRLYCGM